MEDIIVMGVLLLIIIVLLRFCKFLQKLGEKSDARYKAIRTAEQNRIAAEQKERFHKWCSENNIAPEGFTKAYKELIVNQQFDYDAWFSNKDILFFLDAYTLNKAPDKEPKGVFIPYETIKYFTKDGTISYTTETVDNGKNISVSGAIVGGLVAGDAGAVIGSRKDMNKFQNVSVMHDTIHTYIFFEKDGKVELADIYGSQFYQIILRLMPEKEYNYLLHENRV